MEKMENQERQALEQIREIVDGLGADSYIAAAFRGAFAVADVSLGGSGEAAAGPVPRLEDVRLPEAIVREWEAAGQREALRHRAEVAEAQVLALKAKLYDFLISGVQAMQIGESK